MSLATMPAVISPGGIVKRMFGDDFRPARHLDLLNAELMTLLGHAEQKQSYNLAVFAPPRHIKTTILTEVGSAYYLGLFPRRNVIAASHSAALAADKFGATALAIMDDHVGPMFGRQVRPDKRAKHDWGLMKGGGMRSVGVGGSLIGLGADLFIFDDIIASAEDALSEVIRNKAIDWYLSTARTRLNAGGQQIFTMQRWHGDDPAQRIVFDHIAKWSPPNGNVIVLPGIADHDPLNGEVDILGRAVDEALWPQMWPIEKLREIEKDNEFWFAAQYQQRPVPRGGGMFREKWIEDNAVYYEPDTNRRIRWWDRASTEGGGDWTAGVRMSRKGEDYYIEDVIRRQYGSGKRDRLIKAVADQDNEKFTNGIVTWGEQEPGSSGKDAAVVFVTNLMPYPAHCEQSTGSKEIRAEGLASAFEHGKVHVRKGPHKGEKYEWYDALLKEFALFPVGKHDDIVDACSGAFNKLALGKPMLPPMLGPSRTIYDPEQVAMALESGRPWEYG